MSKWKRDKDKVSEDDKLLEALNMLIELQEAQSKKLGYILTMYKGWRVTIEIEI